MVKVFTPKKLAATANQVFVSTELVPSTALGPKTVELEHNVHESHRVRKLETWIEINF